MTAISDYLESGLLNHLFRGETFNKPSGIALALTTTVPDDSDTGSSISEVPSGINGSGTGYFRYNLSNPATSGNTVWDHLAADIAAGSGVIKNGQQIVFGTALVDWGWVSGIAVLDTDTYGSGNMLLSSQLDQPRVVYMGDGLKYNTGNLQIELK